MWDAIGTLAGVSIGYTLFIMFMNATATRHLQAQAELAVAHEIHQVLVPSIKHAAFTSTRVECHEGDVLALLTDGLVEVFDSAGRELGFESAKAALVAVADRSLPEIAGHLLSGARNHGAQLDDQSLLLIRRGAPAPPR